MYTEEKYKKKKCLLKTKQQKWRKKTLYFPQLNTHRIVEVYVDISYCLLLSNNESNGKYA